MLLATVALVGAAVNRLPLPVYLAGRFPRFLITNLYCLSLILWDLRFAGRIHVATIAGASAIILDQAAQAILWHAEGWSDWVVRLLQVLKP